MSLEDNESFTDLMLVNNSFLLKLAGIAIIFLLVIKLRTTSGIVTPYLLASIFKTLNKGLCLIKYSLLLFKTFCSLKCKIRLSEEAI